MTSTYPQTTADKSPGRRVYFDYNATSCPRPEALTAASRMLALVGNPSSVHAEGRRARTALERARAVVAESAGFSPAQLVFTSGATEANNLALRQARGAVLVSAIEHPSVLEYPGAEMFAVGCDGRADLAALQKRLAAGDVDLVSLMLANNETGIIQPVTEAAVLARSAGARLHVDAVQALGRVDLRPIASSADFMTLSAHKVGAPSGCGALLAQRTADLEPMLKGGGHEKRKRAGTENLPAIAGFAAAVGALSTAEICRLEGLRDALETELTAAHPDAVIIGQDVRRLGNTSMISVPGALSETMVMGLDLEGVAVSAGAACSSGKVGRSHVLAAMALPEALARGAFRVSLGWATTEQDVEMFLGAFARMMKRRKASERSLAPAA